MAQVNTYENKDAYTNDGQRSATKSAVSFIQENNETVFDGVNVLVDHDSANVGDLVVFDKITGTNRFIKAGTIVKAQIPDSLYPHSVVLGWKGDKVVITPLTAPSSARWAHPYECRISGIDITAAGTLSVTVGGETASIEWEAGATLDTLTESIATACAALGTATNQQWKAEVDGDDIIMYHNYNAASALTDVSGTGGAENVTYVVDETDLQNNYAYLTATEYLQRVCGSRYGNGGCNKRWYLEYERTNGVSTQNVAHGAVGQTLCEAAFNEEDNPELYALYNGDYEAYIMAESMCQYPACSGAHARDGETVTAMLGVLKGTNVRGEDEPLYPAANSALTFGVILDGYETGLEAGAWHLPDVEEMQMMMRERRINSADSDFADPVNDTLSTMGGSMLYAKSSNMWTCCEYNARNAFYYSVTNGNLYYAYKYISGGVRPVSAL